MSAIIECLLPAALSALSGQGPALHEHMLTPPPNLLEEVSAPPNSQKLLRGNAFVNMIYTENFSVGWPNGMQVSDADAQLAADALESSWQALVVERGWPQPASSDLYYIWVIFDDDISGTGYTTEYFADNYPDGYPVIFMNPNYTSDVDFWTSLASHEFNHALQFGLRDYSSSSTADEDWYWEASAEWGSELSLPDANAYGSQTWYYMSNTEAKYSSMDGYHQYGMSVVNAHLEEHVSGEGGMLAAWVESSTRPLDVWDELISDANGITLDELWGGFTSTVTTMDFNDAVHYYTPHTAGVATDGKSGALPYLGTHYYSVQQTGMFSATGDVILAAPSGWGASLLVNAGETIAVTGRLDQTNSYTIHYSEDVVDTGDTSTTDTPDTGDTSTSGTPDTGDSSTPIDTSTESEDSGLTGGVPPTMGCGCSTSPANRGLGGVFSALLLMLSAVMRRR